MSNRRRVRNKKYQGTQLPRVNKGSRVTNQQSIRRLKINGIERPCVVYNYRGKRKVHVLEDWRLAEVISYIKAKEHFKRLPKKRQEADKKKESKNLYSKNEIKSSYITKTGVSRSDVEGIDTPSVKKEQKINVSKLQIQLSNGMWTDINPKTNPEILINHIKEMENIRAKNMGTKPRFTNEEEIAKALEKGEKLRYGEDWYDQIRIKPKPISEKQKELAYLRQQYWEIDAKIMESEEPSLPSSKLVREKEEIMKKIKELGGTL